MCTTAQLTSNATNIHVPWREQHLSLSLFPRLQLRKAISRASASSSGDPPAPSPPVALGSPELRGEPGPSAGGTCIAVGLDLLAPVSRRWLRGRRLGLGLPLRFFGGGGDGLSASTGEGQRWVSVLLSVDVASAVVDGEEILLLRGGSGEGFSGHL